MSFAQKAFILGKVKSMGIKEMTTRSSGKENYVLEVKMNLVPDNVYFTVSKFMEKSVVGDGSKRGDFLQKAFDEFGSMMNQFKTSQAEGTDFFVSTNIKPSITGKGKEQKTNMYDVFSSTQDENGTQWFSASGLVSVVPHDVVVDDAGVSQTILKFKTKNMNVTELAPTRIDVTMIVADEKDTQLTLTSGGDYPKELEVVIREDEVGKATIGQGYSFTLVFDKIEKVSTEDQSWDEEAKPDFATTILRVKKVLGKVTGYTLDEDYNESEALMNY